MKHTWLVATPVLGFFHPVYCYSVDVCTYTQTLKDLIWITNSLPLAFSVYYCGRLVSRFRVSLFGLPCCGLPPPWPCCCLLSDSVLMPLPSDDGSEDESEEEESEEESVEESEEVSSEEVEEEEKEELRKGKIVLSSISCCFLWIVLCHILPPIRA